MFSWGRGEDYNGFSFDEVVYKSDHDLISLPNLSHKLNLFSAAGYPLYSNYTDGYKQLLDYIFIQCDFFTVSNVAPFPSEDILSEHVALPSVSFPSDHLAVVVDVIISD